MKFTCRGSIEGYSVDKKAFPIHVSCLNASETNNFDTRKRNYGHHYFHDPYPASKRSVTLDRLGVYLATAGHHGGHFKANFSNEQNREIEKIVRSASPIANDQYTVTVYGRALSALTDPITETVESMLTVAADGIAFTPRDGGEPIFTWSFDERAPAKN